MCVRVCLESSGIHSQNAAASSNVSVPVFRETQSPSHQYMLAFGSFPHRPHLHLIEACGLSHNLCNSSSVTDQSRQMMEQTCMPRVLHSVIRHLNAAAAPQPAHLSPLPPSFSTTFTLTPCSHTLFHGIIYSCSERCVWSGWEKDGFGAKMGAR